MSKVKPLGSRPQLLQNSFPELLTQATRMMTCSQTQLPSHLCQLYSFQGVKELPSRTLVFHKESGTQYRPTGALACNHHLGSHSHPCAHPSVLPPISTTATHPSTCAPVHVVIDRPPHLYACLPAFVLAQFHPCRRRLDCTISKLIEGFRPCY